MRFQRKYLLYPRPATGRAAFSFLFTKPFEKLEELPEDKPSTSYKISLSEW